MAIAGVFVGKGLCEAVQKQHAKNDERFAKYPYSFLEDDDRTAVNGETLSLLRPSPCSSWMSNAW